MASLLPVKKKVRTHEQPSESSLQARMPTYSAVCANFSAGVEENLNKSHVKVLGRNVERAKSVL